MRRVSVVFALLAVCALCARGQWFPFPRSQRFQEMPQFTVAAKAHAEPTKPVVGEPCAIILERRTASPPRRGTSSSAYVRRCVS